MSDDRNMPAEVTASSCGCGRGGGNEKSLDVRSSIPVGELMAFDMASSSPRYCSEYETRRDVLVNVDRHDGLFGSSKRWSPEVPSFGGTLPDDLAMLLR